MRTRVLSLGLMLGFLLTSALQANAQCESYPKHPEGEKKENCEEKSENKKLADVKAGDLKKASFAVQGNCSMCEARIEKAAKSVSGVKKASWDKNNDMLSIHYMKEKVDLAEVHKAIANSGHDTAEKEASKEAYASLPQCCQYRDDK